jgi:hypothetical protein
LDAAPIDEELDDTIEEGARALDSLDGAAHCSRSHRLVG